VIPNPSASLSTRFRNVGTALAVASLVVASEYFFRHYVMFWMPTIGTPRVNDMLALALVYSLLTISFGLLTHINWQQEIIRLGQALHDFITSWTYTPWILGLMLSLVALPLVDHLLWANLSLPMRVSSYRNSTIRFANVAPVLNGLALIGVNGVLVPIAEEYLWRGIIQARLLQALPSAWAIGTTAVLFSLKHVVVDASWGRFLTLVAFGCICGGIAQRHTWRSSAMLHLFVNTVITVVALIFSME
jgi:membrane protease YdiL (CAAX protease family)